MSDLISRIELLKAMNTWDKFGCDKYGRLVMLDSTNGKEYVPYVHYEDMVNCVKNMPTAYNIEKVIEKLESNSFITVKQDEVQTKRKDIQSYIAVEKEVVLLKDAIEIVKHGCVDDDVCKWKEIIGFDDMYIKNPHTNVLYINDTKRKNIYCNTCGKKIKVVE